MKTLYSYKYESNNLEFYKYLKNIFPEIDEFNSNNDNCANIITFSDVFDSLSFMCYEGSVPDLCIGDDSNAFKKQLMRKKYNEGVTYDIGKCYIREFEIEFFYNSGANVCYIDLDEHWENDNLFQLSTTHNISDFIKLLSRLEENNLTFKSFIEEIWELYK